MRRFVLLLVFLDVILAANANNVRIVQDIKVEKVWQSVADLKFTIAWDNSWRDDFNWDAVYVFMKYKKKTETDWKHALFMDDEHQLGSGFEYWMPRSNSSDDQRQGMFIFRNEKKRGAAQVEVTAKWNLSGVGYTETDFVEENVEMSLMCIEMVYIPQGPFFLGDGQSKRTFHSVYRPILPEWDLIKNDGTQKYSATNNYDVEKYSVEGPANRVNEGRGNSNYAGKNIWQANSGASTWQVEFPEPKKVRYFGVSGLVGYNGYVPQSWVFEGSVDGKNNWRVLTDNLGSVDWPCDNDSYPVAKAIAVKPENVSEYKFYRIRITSASNAPFLSNIAMTDVDMSQVNDSRFLVDGNTIPMNLTRGLSADDGDTWSNNLQSNYPTGYKGFYAMKYEISQDQWVRFLNKLTPTQQVKRTREDLERLDIGDYIYGSNLKKPNCRNGIVIGNRVEGHVIFSCNLNPNNKVSQEDDGQTLACNYLSVKDMLAYADWAGLRPLSEMEYEKMARRPYPCVAEPKSWVAGKKEEAKWPTTESFIGKGRYDEHLTGGFNVNAGGKVSGPVRVGSFAKGAQKPVQAGASYWGVMDLSGNLAEIYYNANTAGRSFSDHHYGLNHGNGALSDDGDANVSTSYWPVQAAAFGLRGGSFMSEVKGLSEGEIAVSDRSKIRSISELDKADSTTTFRLGHSRSALTYHTSDTYSSYLILQNGKTSKNGDNESDSVCINTTYTIRGTELLDKNGEPVDLQTTYIWYRSDNSGSTWHIIEGENGKDLVYSDWHEDGPKVRPIYIKRVAATPVASDENTAHYVTLNVINSKYTVNRLVDTVKNSNQAMGFLVKTMLPASFTWRWKSADKDEAPLKAQDESKSGDFIYSLYVPSRNDFLNIAKQNHIVQCDILVENKCLQREEMKVYLEQRLKVAIASTDITMGGRDKSKECGVLMQDTRFQSTPGIYATVKIGDQCWMAENLRYDGYIPSKFGVKQDDPSGEKFGYLYTWDDKGKDNLCPRGWRLPTKADFEKLIKEVGMTQIGLKLKAGNYWLYSKNSSMMPQNTVGFGAIGVHYGINSQNNGGYAYYVTSDNTYYRLDYNSDSYTTGGWGGDYMSVRCIKR